MPRLILLLIGLTFVVGVTFGAKTKKVTAEYLYHIPENVSPEAAKETAIQRAMAQAIADEFGTYVSNTSSVRIATSNEYTTTDFLSIGGSELKGEWIETIGEPVFEYLTDGSDVALRVKLRGVIREIENNKIPFQAKVLKNGTDDIYESDVFKDGDDLFFSFRTPSAGYLAIYLIDGSKQAYCLLPYMSMEEGYFRAKANQRYVLFHQDFAEGIEKKIVDEIVASTDLEKETNRVLVIFSPNKFYKAADRSTQSDLPRNLNYSEFQKWLSDAKKRDPELAIEETSITIYKQ